MLSRRNINGKNNLKLDNWASVPCTRDRYLNGGAVVNPVTGSAMHVPAEIYVLFAAFLDFRAIARLSVVCRSAQKGMRARKNVDLGHVRLSLAQAAIRDAVIAMPDSIPGAPTNIFIILAPMGFGKTIVGLSVPFVNIDGGHRYICIVPSAVFDTWVAETIKVFGTGARSITPSTQVVLAHSSIPHHNAHVKRAIDTAGSNGPALVKALGSRVRVIITTSNSALSDTLAATWATRAILDEAHAATDNTWRKIRDLPWITTLSANVVHPGLSKFNLWRGNGDTSSWVVTAGVMEGVVPVANPRQIMISPWGNEAREFNGPHEKKISLEQNIEEYVNALIGIFASIPKGRVVLYLPDGDTSTELVRAAGRYAAGWCIIEFNRAVSKIRKFESVDRSILVAQHAKAVGINIHATHLVVVRPDWVNFVRYAQLMGRVLRPLSPTSSVDTFLIMPYGVPSLRVACAEALRMLATTELHLEPPTFTALEFLKAEACLRACNSSIAMATPIELMSALGMGLLGSDTANTLFTRWMASPTKTLAAPQLRNLLGLGYEEAADAFIDELLGEF